MRGHKNPVELEIASGLQDWLQDRDERELDRTPDWFVRLSNGLIVESLFSEEDWVKLPVTEILLRVFEANILAKWETDAFYTDKEEGLAEIFERSQAELDAAFVSYGIGEDEWGQPVLYFDVTGRGQVSFHFPPYEVHWPKYPGQWTGIRHDWFPDLDPVDEADVARLWREETDGSVGALHNLLVRAGVRNFHGALDVLRESRDLTVAA